MNSIWCLIISTVVLAFAYAIKHFFADMVEDEQPFQLLIVVFLITYIIAAVAISFLNPSDAIKPLFAAQQTQEVQDTVVKL